MSPVWVVPALVLLIGTAATAALLRAAMQEASSLVAELRRAGEIRPVLARLHDETSQLAAGLRAAGRHR